NKRVVFIMQGYCQSEGCEHTWRKFHGHCYRYFSRRHTWEDAEKDCREHSGHLASIHSSAEQNFIRGGWRLRRMRGQGQTWHRKCSRCKCLFLSDYTSLCYKLDMWNLNVTGIFTSHRCTNENNLCCIFGKFKIQHF
uniref:C-type lectin domain-containing protein n=1 Tax=Seriola lalandi dorsalis TaxID=1841481 RepID=A0A3B4WLT8_SERLL